MKPWPGDNGVARCEATAELKKEMLEAVVGAVFLARAAEQGLDRGMEDAWRLVSPLVLEPRLGRYNVAARAWHGVDGPIALLRERLVADRPGHVKAWVERLGLGRLSHPGLVAAASIRAYEGQSLEFLGDGVLRLVQTLHVMRSLPDADRNQKAQVRLAMERNPFLARRLARLVGRADTAGLSFKLRDAHAQALRSISPQRSEAHGFIEDLGAQEGPKILADVLEALLGAVALDGEWGLEGAQRIFARLVVPPPDVLAALAKGDVVVPGNGRRVD